MLPVKGLTVYFPNKHDYDYLVILTDVSLDGANV